MSGQLTRHSPAEIVSVLLWNWDNTWPIYFSNEPDIGDRCITLYDTEGQLDGRAMVDGELWDHWGIQIRIRASEYNEGRDRAALIRKWASETVYRNIVTMYDGASYRVQALTAIGPIISLGRQLPATTRSIFTINLKTPIRELVP